MIGYIAKETDYPFESAISGMGWLIRNGSIYIDEGREFQPHPKNHSFVTLHAPRTSVGVLEDGSIFLAVVDGVELLGEGLDLYEFADILRG